MNIPWVDQCMILSGAVVDMIAGVAGDEVGEVLVVVDVVVGRGCPSGIAGARGVLSRWCVVGAKLVVGSGRWVLGRGAGC